MVTQIDPDKNFRCRLIIDGTAIASFSELQGLTTSVDVIEQRSLSAALEPMAWRTVAGVRDRAALDRAGLRKRSGAVLLTGFQLLPGQTGVFQRWQVTRARAPSPKKSGFVLLNKSAGTTRSHWYVRNAWPCKWKGFTLDGKGTDKLPPDWVLLVFQTIRPARRDDYDYPGMYSVRDDFPLP